MTRLPVLRPAEAGDVPLLADIAFTAWESGILPLMRERSGQREAERSRLAEAARQSFDRIVVATIGGSPVGWVSRARQRPYIPFLFVAPHVQGRGIGGELLSRMESILELRGADRVHLETPADNVRAVRFYERQGYRILALRPDGPHRHEPLMSVHLEKTLHPFRGRVTDGP